MGLMVYSAHASVYAVLQLAPWLAERKQPTDMAYISAGVNGLLAVFAFAAWHNTGCKTPGFAPLLSGSAVQAVRLCTVLNLIDGLSAVVDPGQMLRDWGAPVANVETQHALYGSGVWEVCFALQLELLLADPAPEARRAAVLAALCRSFQWLGLFMAAVGSIERLEGYNCNDTLIAAFGLLNLAGLALQARALSGK